MAAELHAAKAEGRACNHSQQTPIQLCPDNLLCPPSGVCPDYPQLAEMHAEGRACNHSQQT